jgi:hypothetical protein
MGKSEAVLPPAIYLAALSLSKLLTDVIDQPALLCLHEVFCEGLVPRSPGRLIVLLLRLKRFAPIAEAERAILGAQRDAGEAT